MSTTNEVRAKVFGHEEITGLSSSQIEQLKPPTPQSDDMVLDLDMYVSQQIVCSEIKDRTICAVRKQNFFSSGMSQPSVQAAILNRRSVQELLLRHDLPEHAPLRRWTDVHSAVRLALCDLDDIEMPQLSVCMGWLCSHAIAVLCGVPISFAFLLVGFFPPGGYQRETTPYWHTVWCALGHFVCHCPAAHFVAYHDDQLSTGTWYAYYFGWNSMFTLGLRLLVEWTIPLPCTVYVLFLLCPYPLFDNPWHAVLSRIVGEPSWYNPFIWVLPRMRSFVGIALFHEFAYFILTLVGTVLPLGFPVLEFIVFSHPVMNGNILNMLFRPLMGWCFIRASYALFCFGVKQSACPWVKFFTFVQIYVACSITKGRLFSAAKTPGAVLIVLALDWFFFSLGILVYWEATSPNRKSFGPTVDFFLRAMTFEKIMPPPELRTADYRSFELLLKHIAEVLAYVALIAGFGWQKAIQVEANSPAAKFWFPLGLTSLKQIFAGLVSSTFQNLVVQIIVRIASHRYTPTCHFTDIMPGWLYHISFPLKSFMVMMFAFSYFTQLAFALEQDFQFFG